MTTKINVTTSGITESVDTSGVLEIQTGGGSALIINTDQSANFTGNTALTVPNGTTGQRPTPVNGMMRYNTSLSIFEVYANNTWSAANVSPAPTNTVAPVISGSAVVGQNLTSTTGTWSGSPSAYYYQWLANSTAISNATANVFSVSLAQVGANITCNVTAYNVAGNSSPATSNSLGPVIQGVTVNYLVVAGGAGGGYRNGGGGGAGGLQTGTTILQPASTYTVIVGAGGTGSGTSAVNGANGTNSSLSSLSNASVGGGGGATADTATAGGINGGSGGGGAGNNYVGGTHPAGSGTSGQGNAGGTGASGSPYYSAGGGGGSSQTGFNGDSGGNGGAGGNGTSSSISGTATYYAGGGGGGSSNGGIGGVGGSGGGGYGGDNTTTQAANGTTNLGAGGGGASGGGTGASGGSGGSGIVIISYPGAQQFGGGVISTDGSNTIHTFYTSGSIVPLTSVTVNNLLLVGGGGGGGGGASGGGGGGGGGGFVNLANTSIIIDTSSSYVVTVGAGGAQSASVGSPGYQGSNSSFSAYVTSAVGGGRGGYANSPNGSTVGGSGGGGGGNGGSGTGSAGTSGQGNAGGNAVGSGATCGGGGGGGASQAGGNGSSSAGGGYGGNGSPTSISGIAVYYSGGGGGGSFNSSSGSGGIGGGAQGGNGSSGMPGSALANTGGGGGGAGQDVSSTIYGGAGGSGIVIITYPGSTPMMAGGNVTVVSNTVVHTFTSSGYLTPFVLVNKSLRFRSGTSAYLVRTPAVTSNRQTWTWSAWVKRGTLGTTQYLFNSRSSSNLTGVYFLSDQLELEYYDGTNNPYLLTAQYFRDPSAWYHLVAVFDTTNATASDRMRLYVNGTRVTAFSASSNPSQNLNGFINYTYPNYIGQRNDSYGYFDGEMTEVRFIDGQALTPNSFGTFNQYGVWQPVAYAGSYGTNGFYLPFTNTANTTALGYDFSPMGNNYTPNNFSLTAGNAYDSMNDVPTLTSANVSNYCVWSPIQTGGTLTDGNLVSTNNDSTTHGTFAVSAGKYYWEQYIVNVGTNQVIGVIKVTSRMTDGSWGGSDVFTYFNNGNKYGASLNVAYGASYTTGDTIGVALDLDNNTLTFYKNGTSQGTAFSGSQISGLTLQPMYYAYGSGAAASVNFGQQPFTYTPPSGFLPLNTYNL